MIHENLTTPPRGKYFREAKQFLEQFAIPQDAASLSHLATIARRFSAIPYENISKILKFSQQQTVTFRMPDEIYEDFRKFRLGGTCFSLTFFLMEILRFCGYDCEPVLGDMKWGENVHTAILVNFNSDAYVIDPGYMIHQPLRISKDTRQRYLTPHSGIDIRFVPEEERFDLFTFRNGNYTWRYRFTPSMVDMETYTRHWIRSFYMPTMNGIILTKTAQNRMTYIHDDFIKITGREKVERYNSRNTAEQTILNEFGIPLHLIEEARLALREIREPPSEDESDATS